MRAGYSDRQATGAAFGLGEQAEVRSGGLGDRIALEQLGRGRHGLLERHVLQRVQRVVMDEHADGPLRGQQVRQVYEEYIVFIYHQLSLLIIQKDHATKLWLIMLIISKGKIFRHTTFFAIFN
mgnify:CR=1 FL=1